MWHPLTFEFLRKVFGDRLVSRREEAEEPSISPHIAVCTNPGFKITVVESPVLKLLNQESIEQKLKEAEERKKVIETDRWKHVEPSRMQKNSLDLRIKNLANQLAKIDLAQQKREESEKAKVWV